MQAHVEVADRLGLLRWPAGIRVDAEKAMNLDPERVVVLVTGSQGEPSSALARIAVDAHREVEISEGDLVLHSARSIPGNEKPIGRMINHLLRRGAEVITGADAPIHVSGHAARDELSLLVELLRPKFFVPVHGEYRQLAAHARAASAAGLPAEAILLADSGDVIRVDAGGIGIGERVPVGQVFIDPSLDEVDLAVLKDRRRLAGDGIVVAVVAVDRENGALDGDPEIVSRGFVALDDEEEILREARATVRETVARTTLEERGDEGLLKERIQTDLKRFFRRRLEKRPLIIPVIVEL
jgi:ribonuclease J